MARIRALLFHSPAMSAIAAMIALVAVAWGTPELRAHGDTVAAGRAFA